MDDYSPPPAPLHLPLPPVHQGTWQAPDFRPQFGDDRRPLDTFLPTFQSNFAHYTPTVPSNSTSINHTGASPRHKDISTWRAYTPATSTWQPASSSPHNTAPYDRFDNRRSSIPDFKFAPSLSLSPLKETVPEEGGRPRLRKAASSLCIQTTNHHTNHGEVGFRTSTSPYPTPTISPAWNSYFSITGTQPHSSVVEQQQQQCPPQSSSTSHLTYTPYVPPSQPQQAHQQWGSHHQAPPSPTASDSAPHSPPRGAYVPLGLDPRRLVHPMSPRTGSYYAPAETYFSDNPAPQLGENWQQPQQQAAGVY